ncbi:major facilitator superfamily domain-containing protein [Dichotomocladium elegans]|nr:major facilitator superfamily domain-containing protein [Dichotomocladium elegans]
MQEYYERNVFYAVATAQVQISFAGTLMELFADLMGPVYQVLSSHCGIHAVLVIGSAFMVAGLELASLSTQIWHLYLTQGMLFGTGASLLYVAAMNVPAQWFNRRRGLALGIVSSGAGVGGIVLPFVITEINNRLGIAWSCRIVGFICLLGNAISCALIKERYPIYQKSSARNQEEVMGDQQRADVVRKSLREIFDFGILKNRYYLTWVISTMISVMGYFVPFFFLPSYVTQHLNMSSKDASAIQSVMAASTCVGRIVVGFIADRIGRMNALIICDIIAASSAFLIWTFAYTYGTMMAFAVTFGLVCSIYFSSMSTITAIIVGIDKLPTGLSVLLLTNMVPVWGPTLASAIETRITSEPYFSYKMFTGTTFLLGGLILLALKVKMTKSVLTRI